MGFLGRVGAEIILTAIAHSCTFLSNVFFLNNGQINEEKPNV